MSEIVATFDPFRNHLDLPETLKVLETCLDGAEDGELFLEQTKSETLLFDDGNLKKSNFNSAKGFGLRAVNGESIGYAHSTKLTGEALKFAAQTVQLAIKNPAKKTNSPNKTAAHLYSNEDPIDTISFDKKVNLLREIDDYARSRDRRVVQVSASSAAALQELVILRPDGSMFTDTRPMVRINVSIIVEEHGRRESGSSGSGGRHQLIELLQADCWKRHVDEALRVALVNLDSVPAPAGIMDVVLGPGWPGVLLHEAVGHGLEGDFNRKKTSTFSNLFGQKIASDSVTIVDDGTIPNRRGSISIDDEGTPSARNTLIEDGRLVGLMHDRQNARLMGVKPTGNGRRQDYTHAPMPRMTNTFMLGGSEPAENIVENLKNGIYATGFSGGQVDITNGKFVFSCTEAYRVTNGKVENPLKGATIIGDGATALTKIRVVGNDLALDPGIGNCGKSGQWVPVGVGQPTLLIGGLTVGGSQTS